MKAFLIYNGLVYRLGGEVVSIGRSLENQLIFDDPSISRVHAKLIAENGHYEIFDKNSTCGTYVNGRSVARKPLQSGDVITMASVSMIYIEPSQDLLTGHIGRTKPLEEAVEA